MKTFLQICQDVREEAGLSGSGPASVATAVGIEKRIVGWVKQAWVDIQEHCNDWPWRYAYTSFTTSPDKDRYPTVELNLTDVERWDFTGVSIYPTAQGQSYEVPLRSTNMDYWWTRLRIGQQTNQPPEYIFFDPANKDLLVHPTPDGEYTILLRYYKSLQILAANGDIPAMPQDEAWRDIIKWRALWYYGFHDGAPDILGEADDLYEKKITAMENRVGASITFGIGPVA